MPHSKWKISLENKRGQQIQKIPRRQQNVVGTCFFVYQYTAEDVEQGLHDEVVLWTISHKYGGYAVHTKPFIHAKDAKAEAKSIYQRLNPAIRAILDDRTLDLHEYQIRMKEEIKSQKLRDAFDQGKYR
jgi:hypothetical protein